MNWVNILTGALIVLFVFAVTHLASWNEARMRRKERAEEYARHREMRDIEIRAERRQRLREARAKYVRYVAEFGEHPAFVDEIARIDTELAEMRAEQIRKLTEEAAP